MAGTRKFPSLKWWLLLIYLLFGRTSSTWQENMQTNWPSSSIKTLFVSQKNQSIMITKSSVVWLKSHMRPQTISTTGSASARKKWHCNRLCLALDNLLKAWSSSTSRMKVNLLSEICIQLEFIILMESLRSTCLGCLTTLRRCSRTLTSAAILTILRLKYLSTITS